MIRLSSHVLDTARGRPAAGVNVRLSQGDREIGKGTTDADGRCANLIADGAELKAGIYRLVFEVASYFPDGLYPEVTIAFKVAEGVAHYHIPLLISGFGYTTYRGS